MGVCIVCKAEYSANKQGQKKCNTCRNAELRNLRVKTRNRSPNKYISAGKPEIQNRMSPIDTKFAEELDAAQQRLNIEVDKKDDLKFDFIQYTPDHPEWQKICQQVTQPSRIRRFEPKSIFAERIPDRTLGRQENINEMR